MPKTFVLTLTGHDRIGFVEEVTRLVFQRGGNVETSRMARLGGEFAMLMLVSMPAEHFSQLEKDLEVLAGSGHKITTAPAESAHAEAQRDWRPYRIEVQGADHEGIIHEIARFLSDQGISIEAADSDSTPAPTSGSPLFAMIARVIVPPGLSAKSWQDGLDAIGDRMNLDININELRD